MNLKRCTKKEEMVEPLSKITGRWKFVLFILISAILMEAILLIIPEQRHAIKSFCVSINCILLWGPALVSRLKVVGLSVKRWMIYVIELLIVSVFYWIYQVSFMGRIMAPVLFVLIQLPLLIFREKPDRTTRDTR